LQDTLSTRIVPESSVSFDANQGLCYQREPSPEGVTPMKLDSSSTDWIGPSAKFARLSQFGT
jgi:hypothetical protein